MKCSLHTCQNAAHQILSDSMPLALLRYVLDWILGELEVESLDGVPDVRHVRLGDMRAETIIVIN